MHLAEANKMQRMSLNVYLKIHLKYHRYSNFDADMGGGAYRGN